MKTLQECKDSLAKDLGYKDWDSIIWYELDESNGITKRPYSEEKAWNQVAELYSSEKDKEIERLKGLLSKAFEAGAEFGEEDGYTGIDFNTWKKQQGL